jgi:hypothetical protein
MYAVSLSKWQNKQARKDIVMNLLRGMRGERFLRRWGWAAGSDQTAWRSLYCHFRKHGAPFVQQHNFKLRLYVQLQLTHLKSLYLYIMAIVEQIHIFSSCFIWK